MDLTESSWVRLLELTRQHVKSDAILVFGSQLEKSTLMNVQGDIDILCLSDSSQLKRSVIRLDPCLVLDVTSASMGIIEKRLSVRAPGNNNFILNALADGYPLWDPARVFSNLQRRACQLLETEPPATTLVEMENIESALCQISKLMDEIERKSRSDNSVDGLFIIEFGRAAYEALNAYCLLYRLWQTKRSRMLMRTDSRYAAITTHIRRLHKARTNKEIITLIREIVASSEKQLKVLQEEGQSLS